MPDMVKSSVHIKSAKPAKSPDLRAKRSDGLEKRSLILEVAGRIYAEKGHAGTTSKEICEAAGIDMAAVNYHFGSKGALYDAVLTEAHAHLVKLDDLESIAQSKGGPESKLRALLALLLEGSGHSSLPWGLRVLMHEIVSPSSHIAAFVRTVELPKVHFAKAIVAGVLGVPVTHPAVQRAIAFIVMPCVMLTIAPRELRQTVLPALSSDPQALLDDMTSYALAGLKSLSRKHAKKKRAAD
jgi:TetR/AcrR family transcriptional regulator, regulator of cefoperazone and chloramphenicol sensitivity